MGYLNPVIVQWPATPDGFSEVTIEVDSAGRIPDNLPERRRRNAHVSRIVATAVVGPEQTASDCRHMLDYLAQEYRRRCLAKDNGHKEHKKTRKEGKRTDVNDRYDCFVFVSFCAFRGQFLKERRMRETCHYCDGPLGDARVRHADDEGSHDFCGVDCCVAFQACKSVESDRAQGAPTGELAFAQSVPEPIALRERQFAGGARAKRARQEDGIHRARMGF